MLTEDLRLAWRRVRRQPLVPFITAALLAAGIALTYGRDAGILGRELTTRVRVDSLRRGLTYAIETRPGLQRAALLVLALSVLIFLGHCLTLALLSVARGVRQQHQTTVMLAIGAGKGRLFRTDLLESAGISGAAVFGGLLLMRSLTAAAAAWLPAAPELDWRLQAGTGVVTMAGLMALVAAGIIGAIPAVISTRTPLHRLVQASGRVSLPHVRLRVALLTVQLGLAVLLVHYALVFVGDLRAIARVDVGFNVNDLHIYSLTARPPQRPLSNDYFVALLERVRRIPGVESAAITGTLPPLACLAAARNRCSPATAGRCRRPASARFPACSTRCSCPASLDRISPGMAKPPQSSRHRWPGGCTRGSTR